MNIAIFPTGQNALGIPPEWPARKRYLAEGEEAPDGWVEIGGEDDYAAYVDARQAAYDSGTAAARYKAEMPALIKAEAQRRICARLGYTPDQIASWTAKQINMTARGTEIERAERRGEATPQDLAELAQLEGFFAWVKLVRAWSNLLEGAVANGETVNLQEGWPE